MKNTLILIIFILLVVGTGSLLFFTTGNQPQVQDGNSDTNGASPDENLFTVGDERWMRHTDEPAGIEFAYRINPNGYILQEQTPREHDIPLFKKTFVLMLQTDFEELQASTEPREGPPTINISVFENPDNLPARLWAEQYTAYSNFDVRLSDVEDDSVGALHAIRYRADGLYVSDVMVLGRVGYIYVLSGAYATEDSLIKQDFQNVVDTITFIGSPDVSNLIQVTTPQENAVIESPLTITGQARGNWFFEASFPIALVDWDGRIIAEHFIMTSEDWMTTEFVAFEGMLEFESPYTEGDPEFMRRGTLILQKDNPSGLPEHDAALEIPIEFVSA